MFDQMSKRKAKCADYALLEKICCRDYNEKITEFDDDEGSYKFHLATTSMNKCKPLTS